MGSRMEKYDNVSNTRSRTTKNEKLYDKVGDIYINYDYIDVNNAVELDPSNDYKASRENYHKKREFDNIIPSGRRKMKDIDDTYIPNENKVYDINEILKAAREESDDSLNEAKKRLINTEYNILTKLDIKKLDKDNYRKEDLKSLIDDIYKKEAPKKIKEYKNRSENELLSDLMDNDDHTLSKELNLKEELSKNILEKNLDDGTVPITEEIKDLSEDMNEVEDEKINNKEIPNSYKKSPDENEMFIFDSLNTKKDEKKKKKRKKDADIEINNIVKEEAMKEDGIDYDEIDKDGRGLLIAIIVVVILILLTILFFVYEYFFG